MQNSFELSIIIPLLNEEESIRPLFKWILKALQGKVSSLEVIFIDDGSIDGSWKIIQTLAKEHYEV